MILMFLAQFAKTYRADIPWFGILVSTVVASALMAFSYSSNTGLTVFTYLVTLSVVTVAIPCFFSACAQLAFLVSRRRRSWDGHSRGTCRSPPRASRSRCG